VADVVQRVAFIEEFSSRSASSAELSDAEPLEAVGRARWPRRLGRGKSFAGLHASNAARLRFQTSVVDLALRRRDVPLTRNRAA